MANGRKKWKQWQILFSWSPKSLQIVTAAMKVKDTCSWKKRYDKPRQCIKKQRHHFANKAPSSQSYSFSSGHVWMWESESEVAQSCLTLIPHGLQHASLPCPSPTPGVSCPLRQWCHPTISSSVIPFSSCSHSFPASRFFKWVSFSHQVAKVLEFQLKHQSFQWTFRADLL